MASLVPCMECARHVRVGEDACPFCGGSLAKPRELAPLPTDRALTRAAVMFMGVTALASCGKSSDAKDPQPTPTIQPPGPAPAYGPAPVDSTVTPVPNNTQQPSAPAYGAPPIATTTDAGKKK